MSYIKQENDLIVNKYVDNELFKFNLSNEILLA